MKNKNTATPNEKKKLEFVEPELTKHETLVKNTLMPIGNSGEQRGEEPA